MVFTQGVRWRPRLWQRLWVFDHDHFDGGYLVHRWVFEGGWWGGRNRDDDVFFAQSSRRYQTKQPTQSYTKHHKALQHAHSAVQHCVQHIMPPAKATKRAMATTFYDVMLTNEEIKVMQPCVLCVCVCVVSISMHHLLCVPLTLSLICRRY